MFVGFVTQLCSPPNVCAWSVDKRVHTQSSLSVFTTLGTAVLIVFTHAALWCSFSVVKLTFYLHHTPSWFWLVWTNSPVFTLTRVWTSRHNGTNNARTLPVLTVLKWRITTTLNRKLLEKQRVQNRFASYEV